MSTSPPHRSPLRVPAEPALDLRSHERLVDQRRLQIGAEDGTPAPLAVLPVLENAMVRLGLFVLVRHHVQVLGVAPGWLGEERRSLRWPLAHRVQHRPRLALGHHTDLVRGVTLELLLHSFLDVEPVEGEAVLVRVPSPIARNPRGDVRRVVALGLPEAVEEPPEGRPPPLLLEIGVVLVGFLAHVCLDMEVLRAVVLRLLQDRRAVRTALAERVERCAGLILPHAGHLLFTGLLKLVGVLVQHSHPHDADSVHTFLQGN